MYIVRQRADSGSWEVVLHYDPLPGGMPAPEDDVIAVFPASYAGHESNVSRAEKYAAWKNSQEGK